MTHQAPPRPAAGNFQALVEGAPTALLVFAADGSIVFANPTAARLVGAADAASLTSVDDLAEPRLRSLVRRRIARILAGDRVSAARLGLTRRDGTSPVVVVDARLISWRDGTAVLAELEDATAQVAVEEALRAGEEHFRSAWVHAPVGLARIGDGGLVLEANAAFCALVRRSSREVVGRSVHEFTHPDDLEETRWQIALLEASPGSGKTVTLEKRYLRPSGDPVWVIVNATRVVASDGVSYTIAQARDISERKQLEAELLALHEGLDRRVAERTAELEEANRRLRDTVAELEGFAYTVAHDLRQPVRAIIAFGDQLEEEIGPQLTPTELRELQQLRRVSRHLAGQVDGLLALNRVVRAPLSPRAVDISALASAAVERLRTRDPQRSVVAEVEPGITVRGDPRLLRALVDELVGNAWKFTAPVVDARIAISSRRRHESVQIVVQDNGVGFDAQYASELFGVFRRQHEEGEFAGSGIGLASVLRIAQRHGGSVTGEGALGRGATFTVSLPEVSELPSCSPPTPC